MTSTRTTSQGRELFPLQARRPCRGGLCPAFTLPSRGHWEPLSPEGQGKTLFSWAPRYGKAAPSAFASLVRKAALVHKFDLCHSSACSRRSELPNAFFPLSCFHHFLICCSTAQAAALCCSNPPVMQVSY